MADPDHLSKLRQGVDAWNAWRKTEDVIPDLREAHLSEANLRGATFGGADLWGAGLARRFPASVYLDRA